jgi:Putative MetA-pathway of phenol degradation
MERPNQRASRRDESPSALRAWQDSGLPHSSTLRVLPDSPWSLAILAAVLLVSCVGGAWGQDMEPRAYSAVPIDANFLIANYQRMTGSVSLDPSLPITGVKASINTGTLAYDRTFDLFGTTASAALAVPYVNGEVSGQVFTEGKEVARSGLGDFRVRFTDNFIGNPALSAKAFAERKPAATAGVSLTVVAPTGDYDPNNLVNIGSNRWAFRPDIGVSQPFGDWFADAAVGAWLFTDNGNFFQGHVHGQAPIVVAQTHGGYNFRPGLWLAADVIYYSGGETTLNGVADHDAQTVWRYGFTLSVPLTEGFSAKFAWATWLEAHNNGTYDTIGVTLQYRWFDP